ncbi:MAG: ribbon-helix-helix domain-containing protein [Vulcanimicrobiaceae bacterium]
MKKMTISLGPKSEATLARLAKRDESSQVEIVRRGVAIYAALSDQAAQGNRVVLQKPDGSITELVAL